MPYSDSNLLVSTQWLGEHLGAPDVRVVDASWYLPNENRDTRADYAECHIPGAVFFDIDDVCDEASDLPHMLPSIEKFSSRTRKMGLGDGNRVVVYDTHGLFSAPRVWWMFKIMGHADVAVLDGGLPKWVAEDRTTEDLQPMTQERHFTARFNTMMLRTVDDMARNIETGDEQVLDARGPGRFTGADTEPRPGIRSGHIPNAINLPYTNLLDKNGTLLPTDQLRNIFTKAGVDLARPVVTTCGSGITASILYLALSVLGNRNTALYDGSWAEWGSQQDLPLATGTAP